MSSEEKPPVKPMSAFARFRRTRVFQWGWQIVLALLIFWGVNLYQTKDMPIGDAAPDALLEDLDSGKRVALSGPEGSKTMLVFWAPWCGVCQLETGAVSALAKAYEDDPDVRILSVATGYGSRAEVRKFQEEYGVDYPVLLDDTGKIAKAYGVNKFPTHYVIKDSEIQSASVGYTTEWGARFRLMF